MEYVKDQGYIDYSADPHAVYDPITPSDGNYSIDFTVVPFNPITGVPYTPYGGGIFDGDEGIQKITVIVEHNDKDVITLEGYKVDR